MSGERVITGRMVLVGMLAFFGVVFAANGALVFFALETWPGLAAGRAYDTGLRYNQVLETARHQKALGWLSTLSLDAAGETVVVRIAAPDGTPVEGLRTRITFRRPIGDEQERIATLAERTPGTYAGAAALPLAGRWYGIVEAARDGQPVFRMDHEIMVKR
ncbi:MAG: FixH family protein [Rhodospirillales bacterium]|nr:FixH family protein [Rhodospirillales bacterium]